MQKVGLTHSNDMFICFLSRATRPSPRDGRTDHVMITYYATWTLPQKRSDMVGHTRLQLQHQTYLLGPTANNLSLQIQLPDRTRFHESYPIWAYGE
jgi:hypothetical protein